MVCNECVATPHPLGLNTKLRGTPFLNIENSNYSGSKLLYLVSILITDTSFILLLRGVNHLPRMNAIKIVSFHKMIIKLICSNNNTRLILTSSTNRKFDHNSTRITNDEIARPIIFQLTTGMVGLKGATRSSIYGGENLYKKFIERLKVAKLYNNTFVLLVKGFGPTRHFLLHKLAQLKISKIQEITSYPHNGCRLPKSLRK